MVSNSYKNVIEARKLATQKRKLLSFRLTETTTKKHIKEFFDNKRELRRRRKEIENTNLFGRTFATTEEPLDLRLHAQQLSIVPWKARGRILFIKLSPAWEKHIYRAYHGAIACAYIKIVPYDLLMNNIVPLLPVEDLISLRTVDKQFYILLHNVTIWRRFLQKMQTQGFNLPILRPTFDTLLVQNAYEIEQLVRRSITLERDWRSGMSTVRHCDEHHGMNIILDVRFVPGGKFVIASAKDKDHFRFFVLLFALDVLGGIRLIGRVRTESAAFDLRAHYGRFRGVNGIFISYTDRRPLYKCTAEEMIEIESAARGCHFDDRAMVYETCLVHFDLERGEELMNPDPIPGDVDRMFVVGPCTPVMSHRAHAETREPALFLVDETQVIFGFVTSEGGADVLELWEVDIPAQDEAKLSLSLRFADHPSFPGMPHRIQSWSYSKWTNQILVVRSVSLQPGTNAHILFEFYDMGKTKAHGDVVTMSCTNPWMCDDNYQVDKFTISLTDRDDHQSASGSPPTLWVFASINSQKQQGQFPQHQAKGSIFWLFQPEKAASSTIFRYMNAIEPGATLTTHTHLNENHDERVLPGVHRTLVVEVDEGITEAVPIFKLRRFMFPDSRFPALPPSALPNDQTVTKAFPPQSRFVLRDIIDKDHIARVMEKGGIKAIDWDEGSGKIVIAHPNSVAITVLNLGDYCDPGQRLACLLHKDLTRPNPEERVSICGLEWLYGPRQDPSKWQIRSEISAPLVISPPRIRKELCLVK